MQRRMNIRLSIMMFLQYAVPAATFPILSHYLKNVLLFDGKQTGIILAMPAAAAMVTPLLASHWADRLISAERLMALCHLLAAFAMIWMRQMDTFWGVLIAYFCYGLAFTPTFGLTNAIGMHNVEDVKRDFGGIRGWGTFGWVVLSFAFAYFWLKGGDGSGARLADGMYVAAIVSLLLAVYSLTFKPVINHEGTAPIAYGEVLKIFRRPSLLLLCVATFVNSTCHMAFYFGMGLQMNQMGYANSSIQPLMSIGQATEVILLWTLGWFLVRLGMKRAMIIALLAQFLRMILFASGNPTALIIGIALHGIIFAFYFTTAYLYLDSHCTPKTRAGAQQVLTLIHAGIGSCTGFILFGYIVEWAKHADGYIDFRFFWGGPAVISIGLALVLALFFKEETKSSQ